MTNGRKRDPMATYDAKDIGPTYECTVCRGTNSEFVTHDKKEADQHAASHKDTKEEKS